MAEDFTTGAGVAAGSSCGWGAAVGAVGCNGVLVQVTASGDRLLVLTRTTSALALTTSRNSTSPALWPFSSLAFMWVTSGVYCVQSTLRGLPCASLSRSVTMTSPAASGSCCKSTQTFPFSTHWAIPSYTRRFSVCKVSPMRVWRAALMAEATALTEVAPALRSSVVRSLLYSVCPRP